MVIANNHSFFQDNIKSSKASITSLFPNPVKDRLVITFYLDHESNVTIEFFDLTGKKVKEIPKKIMATGEYDIELDATELKSGVYLCKISTSTWIEAKRFIINH